MTVARYCGRDGGAARKPGAIHAAGPPIRSYLLPGIARIAPHARFKRILPPSARKADMASVADQRIQEDHAGGGARSIPYMPGPSSMVKAEDFVFIVMA